MTFDLDPVLLTETAREVIPRATGELVWVPWQETAESCTPAVRPMVLIHGPDESRDVDRVTMVPALPAHDPLLQHMALVLQVAIAGEGVAGQLYAESLIDALAVHFLKRYAAARPSRARGPAGSCRTSCGARSPISRRIWRRSCSLATLAAVAQTSPAHFARLFKHATGLAPHQYVITCRMAHARRLIGRD